jgi:hypothetical protein
MKVESVILSDHEFMCAVEMFVTDEFEKYGYALTDIDMVDYNVDDLYNFIDKIDPNFFDDCDWNVINDFLKQFDSEWGIYILYTKTEVCGLIAFHE